VCGKESYERILISKPDGDMLSPTNWYTGGYIYILNRLLHADSEVYGPFSMRDIWNLPRIPARTSLECLEYVDDRFSFMPAILELARPHRCWKLSEDKPCNFEENPSTDIRKSIEFVKDNYALEMDMCDGIIVAPLVVTREEFNHDCIRISKRDGFYITMIKFIGMWFILQACRSAYLDNDHSWYFVHKEYAI
jgi:hypothetical protein